MTNISGAYTAQNMPPQTALAAERQGRSSDQHTSTNAAWLQGHHQSARQAEASVLALSRLAARDPGALSLHLAQQGAQRQQQIAALREKLRSVSGLLTTGAQTLEVVDTFERIMTEANEGTVKSNGNILGVYADFMSGLSSLMVKINASVTAAKDGKSNLNGKNILAAIDEFSRTFPEHRRKLGAFTQQRDALAFQERFRGNTTEITWNNITRTYDVRLSLSGLFPILDAIGNGPIAANSLKTNLREGTSLSGLPEILVRTDPVTSPTVQALSLATSDVQKTFQTDLDLQINELSRSISQFDNLVKLFSSMVASLTDTYKTFLA